MVSHVPENCTTSQQASVTIRASILAPITTSPIPASRPDTTRLIPVSGFRFPLPVRPRFRPQPLIGQHGVTFPLRVHDRLWVHGRIDVHLLSYFDASFLLPYFLQPIPLISIPLSFPDHILVPRL